MRWPSTISTFLATGVFLLAPAWALMPPHVEATNIRNGILTGLNLVIRGYSLEFSDPPKELSLTHADGATAVQWKHTMECTETGDCSRNAPLGACQSSCLLTLTLSGLKEGDRLHLRYLDLDSRFELKLKP